MISIIEKLRFRWTRLVEPSGLCYSDGTYRSGCRCVVEEEHFVVDRFLWRREKELDFHFGSSGDSCRGAILALASTSADLAIAAKG